MSSRPAGVCALLWLCACGSTALRNERREAGGGDTAAAVGPASLDGGSLPPATADSGPDPTPVIADGGPAPLPDATPLMPDSGLVVPDAAFALPDAALVVPDAALVVPDVAFVPPDATLVVADVAFAVPDATAVVPDAAGVADRPPGCNTLVSDSPALVATLSSAPAPLPMGGPVVAGVYDLVSIVGHGAQSSCAYPILSGAAFAKLVLAASSSSSGVADGIVVGFGSENRFAFSYHTTGTTFSFTNICGESADGVADYTATASELVIIDEPDPQCGRPVSTYRRRP